MYFKPRNHLKPRQVIYGKLIYRKSLGVVSKVRAARGVNRKNVLLIHSTTITILNDETITFTALFGLLGPENIKRYAGSLKIYTIAVPSASGVIFGHVSRVLTAIHRSRGGAISCTVRGRPQQGKGLEVPCSCNAMQKYLSTLLDTGT